MSLAEFISTKSSPAPSPFLPGTHIQYAWDSTSLGYLKTCPRLYYYIMIEGYGDTNESIHLRFGQEYHSALENFDRLMADGLDAEQSIHRTVRDLLVSTAGWEVDLDTRAGKYKNRESLVRSVINHIDHFADDPAETLILDNGDPAVELSFQFQLEWGPKQANTTSSSNVDILNGTFTPDPKQPYLLCGHLDKVVTFNEALYFKDYKTTITTPGSYYFDQFNPSNQMTLYTLASQIILGSPIKGGIIDACQLLLTPPYNKFVRGFTQRTPDQLTEWQDDLAYWFSVAEGYANNSYWPMNDTACDKFGGCRFREICQKSPGVREKFLASKFTKLEEAERWNPLKAR